MVVGSGPAGLAAAYFLAEQGYAPIVLERVMDLGRGDDCNVSHLAMGVHSGTHMDAPVHFIHQAPGLDEMPLIATMFPLRPSIRGAASCAPTM